MHWSLIVLFVVLGLVVYALGVGVTLGFIYKIEGWSSDDGSVVVICFFFWIVVLPILLLARIANWATDKVEKI